MLSCRKLIIGFLFIFALISCFSSSAVAGNANHSYDSLSRLIQTIITDGSKTTTITYQYDAAGNMATFITESETPVTIESFADDFGRANCNGGCPADLDGDCDVDGKDLQIFSASFGL